MKLFRLGRSTYDSSSSYSSIVSRVFKMEFYSTTTFSNQKDTLYRRISPAGNPNDSIVPILDQWAEEVKTIDVLELRTTLKRLRTYNRYADALQLSEWMNSRINLDPSGGDIAIQLDLVSRVHGLKQAEKYFHSIPETSRTFKIYGALLKCYADSKSLGKTGTLMHKMKELGFLTTHSYNIMANLYHKTRNHKKLDTLVQEMEKMGITCDTSTLYIRLKIYASARNIDGMESLLKKMEADQQLRLRKWHAYITAARGYIKAGLVEKSITMLKKTEEVVTDEKRSVAYDFLLTFYANIGKVDEVYRVWGMYKKIGKIYNSGYAHMISSLIRLDDINGAEKILAEWECGNTAFDFKIPNMLINAYGKRGLFEKAEGLLSKFIGIGKEIPASTWDLLATAYCKDNQMEKAVETMKKADLAYKGNWKLNVVTRRTCLKYLIEKGDVELAGEFESLLGEQSKVVDEDGLKIDGSDSSR